MSLWIFFAHNYLQTRDYCRTRWFSHLMEFSCEYKSYPRQAQGSGHKGSLVKLLPLDRLMLPFCWGHLFLCSRLTMQKLNMLFICHHWYLFSTMLDATGPLFICIKKINWPWIKCKQYIIMILIMDTNLSPGCKVTMQCNVEMFLKLVKSHKPHVMTHWLLGAWQQAVGAGSRLVPQIE